MSECINPERWLTSPYIIPKSQEEMFQLVWNVDKEFATGIKSICLQREGRIYEVTVDYTKDHEIEMRVILEFIVKLPKDEAAFIKEKKVRENYDYRRNCLSGCG